MQSSGKQKRKKKRPSPGQSPCGACKVKPPKRVLRVVAVISKVVGARRCRSTGDALLKARLKALDRHSLHFNTECWPPAFELAEKNENIKSFSCSTVRDCFPAHFAMETEPSWKHSCMRQTMLFGHDVVKNEDNVLY